VVGSRYVPGGETPDWSLSRRVLSRGGNLYARIILGGKISDYTGGYNMYSSALMKRIDPSTIYSSGYGFLIDLKFHALKHAKSVHQIPIVFADRQHGKSKLPKSTILKNLLLVPRIRLGD
jgi:dolichol-phosphate mannosyltransferase